MSGYIEVVRYLINTIIEKKLLVETESSIRIDNKYFIHSSFLARFIINADSVLYVINPVVYYEW